MDMCCLLHSVTETLLPLVDSGRQPMIRSQYFSGCCGKFLFLGFFSPHWPTRHFLIQQQNNWGCPEVRSMVDTK